MNPPPEKPRPPLPPPPPDYAGRVPRVPETTELVFIGPDHFGRDAYLCPRAARAWQAMRLAAAAEAVDLLLISAFRSIERQAAILAAKLEKGVTLEQALEYSAYPGFSEHHSGRAIDIGCADCAHLEEVFEQTRAFAWLCQHGKEFGFSLSYPRDNPSGIAYEPWHWCHAGDVTTVAQRADLC